MITGPESLDVTTPGDREIVVTRSFAAPRTLVFDAHTKPELVRRWLLGPPGWTMSVCEMDLRAGGAYRWVWRKDDGTLMGMGGVHREVVPPERIVNTQLFEKDAERNLYAAVRKAAASVVVDKRMGKYQEALEEIAGLRKAVDGFFEEVMVMAEDEAVRKNRLALLAEILREFTTIADFSELGGEV